MGCMGWNRAVGPSCGRPSARVCGCGMKVTESWDLARQQGMQHPGTWRQGGGTKIWSAEAILISCVSCGCNVQQRRAAADHHPAGGPCGGPGAHALVHHGEGGKLPWVCSMMDGAAGIAPRPNMGLKDVVNVGSCGCVCARPPKTTPITLTHPTALCCPPRSAA